MTRREMLQEAMALDPESRRAYLLRNLNKLDPRREELPPWSYEMPRAYGEHVAARPVIGSGGKVLTLGGVYPGSYDLLHSGTARTCEACWQARYQVYIASALA